MVSYDPTTTAVAPQKSYPVNVVAGTEWARCEPLITPQLLVQRFLFGIPLVSQLVNPLSGKRDVKTPEILKDHIIRAVQKVEAESGIHLFPVQVEDDVPFDRVFIQQYSYFRTKQRPVLSVDKISIHPQNNSQATDIYVLPAAWVSLTSANKGMINVVPLVTADSGVFPQAVTSAGALFLLSYATSLSFVASYWQVKYTAGFPEGQLPGIVNELVGIVATMDILSDIASNFRTSSYSLGLDGMSQSSSTPGPQVYKVRMDELMAQKKILMGRIRSIYGTKLSMGTL